MASKSGRSSYRKTFGNQTTYSTAGTKSSSKSFAKEDPIATKRVSYSFSSSSGSGQPFGTNLLETEMLNLNLNEKETLIGLNNRFVTYIEKVRFLEEQNEKLERQIREAGGRQETDLGEDKRAELRRLRLLLDDAVIAKIRSEIERNNLKGEASEFRWKLDHESRLRSELDDELARLRKDVDDATMVRVDVERKIETLREELEYGKKLHDEEVEVLKEQIKNQTTNIEVDGVAPDVAELLQQIREQYEQMVMKNRDEAELWYKTKFDELQDRSKANLGDLENVQAEINDYRKQVTHLAMEMEALRGSNEYLERNLADVEKRYELQASRYQGQVSALSAELDKATAEMRRHLAEYKRLMNVKLSLEKEIMTYRKLLEGEEKTIQSSSSSSSESDDEMQRKTRKTVLVKTIETRDGKILSSTVAEKQVLESRISTSDDEGSSSSSNEE